MHNNKTVRLRCNASTQSYLCGSAPVQKTLSKPLRSTQGGRSQGRLATICGDEARQVHRRGGRVGSAVVRVSQNWTKHGSSPSGGALPRRRRVPSGANRVCGGLTCGKRFINSTGEVPRCSPQRASEGITIPYKVSRNGGPKQRRAEDFSSRLLFRDDSRSGVVGPPGPAKGETVENQDLISSLSEQLALKAAATKRPVRASSRTTQQRAKKHSKGEQEGSGWWLMVRRINSHE